MHVPLEHMPWMQNVLGSIPTNSSQRFLGDVKDFSLRCWRAIVNWSQQHWLIIQQMATLYVLMLHRLHHRTPNEVCCISSLLSKNGTWPSRVKISTEASYGTSRDAKITAPSAVPANHGSLVAPKRAGSSVTLGALCHPWNSSVSLAPVHRLMQFGVYGCLSSLCNETAGERTIDSVPGEQGVERKLARS